MSAINFNEITSDDRNSWLNQSVSDFSNLVTLADRQTLRANTSDIEQAVFKLHSNGVKTQRDEWVFDYDRHNLSSKIKFIEHIYEDKRRQLAGTDFGDSDLGTEIKWDYDLRNYLRRNIRVKYSQSHVVNALYRPFTKKNLYFLRELNGRQYQNPNIFPQGVPEQNKIICFSGVASNKPFAVLSTDRLISLDMLEKTQCLPLYRYSPEGEQIGNITEWGLRRFREHYEQDDIIAEEIFAYTYAVLHDPKYRKEYEVDLKQEFPRLFLHDDFYEWARLGRELLDLHIGFESATLWNLDRIDMDTPAGKPVLRANKDLGTIILDRKTTLTGVPESAWKYRLGSRSALEWVLDQYKERKPRDPTIRERFNTYHFADHKERVIDLLQRVCTVSVETVRIVDQLAELSDIQPAQTPPNR